MKRRVFAMAALVLAGIFLSAEKKEGKFESVETHSFMEAKNIEVLNINGSIKAEMWDSSYIKVIAVKKAKKEKEMEKIICRFEEKGENAYVKTEKSDENEVLNNVSADYTVMLPEKGSIKLAETENGSIDISYSAEGTNAESSNGSITIKFAKGPASAKTDNGCIKIDAESVLKAISSNGSVTVKVKSIKSDAEISTSNGNVKLSVDDVSDAEFEMETSIGKAKVNGIDAEYSKNSSNRKRFKVGNGKHKIVIETSIGNVSLSKSE